MRSIKKHIKTILKLEELYSSSESISSIELIFKRRELWLSNNISSFRLSRLKFMAIKREWELEMSKYETLLLII